jgi:hypothetical protein
MKSEHAGPDTLCNGAAISVQSQDILNAWRRLDESEKIGLLPHLLASIDDWHSMSRDDGFLVGWLRRKFASAGLAF